MHLRDRTRPGTGARAFRIRSLAGTKLQIVESDQSRVASVFGGRLERGLQQIVRAGIAGRLLVHGGCRKAGDPDRAVGTNDWACQRMRRMWRPVPAGSIVDVDQDAAGFYLHWKSRYPIVLESRLAKTRDPVKLPLMPGADNIVAVQRPFAERAAGMIADIVNSTEFLTDATERYLQPSDLVTLQRLRAKQFRRADIDPILVHHLRLACGFVAALLFCRPAKSRKTARSPQCSGYIHRSSANSTVPPYMLGIAANSRTSQYQS